MGNATRPAVYTIPAHRGFADAFVARVVDDLADAERGLSDTLILIPNNRAGRALTEAFVRRVDNGLLLPRMAAVGDLDLNERLGSALEPLGNAPDVPPAIDSLTRQMLLSKLVARHFPRKEPLSEAEALRLACDLAAVLDQMQIEQIPLAALRDVDVGDLGEHWQKNFALLEVLLTQWPETLAARGQIDPAERRNIMLAHVAKTWAAEQPKRPIIAAGITTAAPAMARLLRVVAELPKGMVVFPHLDLAMPEEDWDLLGPHAPDPVHPNAQMGRAPRNIETHPQFHLKLLLDRMGIARGEVIRWTRSGESDAPAIRSKVISNAFAPAEQTARWATTRAEERNLSAVHTLEAADSHEEALAIALAIREVLEVPEERVALVTANRALAERVSAQLRRWDIQADDSAGAPLDKTPPGAYLLLLLEAAASRFAPVELLQLLKHPLAAADVPMRAEAERGIWRAKWLEQVRTLDLALRGPRPDVGVAGIATAAKAYAKIDGGLSGFWEEVAPVLTPLLTIDDMPFAEQLSRIMEVAQAMSMGDVWTRQAGQELAAVMASLAALGDAAPRSIALAEWPAWLAQVLARCSVRPAWGGHPRVAIYGLLEARMQQADLVICAGLNEGSWPQLPSPDPWLAPALRRRLGSKDGDGSTGLPALERNIGLSAHDLASLMGAPRVLLTRARRDEGSPAIASRFWLRLKALAGKRGLNEETRLLDWARALDRAEAPVVMPRPAPSPPPERRRVELAVTDLDRLRADPYAFYAKAILRLKPLDLVDARPTPAWRGNMVHDVLEAWAKHDGLDGDTLRARALHMVRELSAHPLTRILWEPRLMQSIDWIAAHMAACIADGRRPVVIEGQAKAEILGVLIKGKADRIDRTRDGKLIIVDYKTGKPPSAKSVAEGYSLQLGLLGMLASEGGFAAPDETAPKITGIAEGFEYWSLAKHQTTKEFGYVTSPIKGNTALTSETMVPTAREHLEKAIALWILGVEPFTAKLHPEYAPYADYDHLMRVAEWYGRETPKPEVAR